jgi:hypothetical protein
LIFWQAKTTDKKEQRKYIYYLWVLDRMVFEITAGRGSVVKSLSPWKIALKRDHPGK